jgi:hypothetical protein
MDRNPDESAWGSANFGVALDAGLPEEPEQVPAVASERSEDVDVGFEPTQVACNNTDSGCSAADRAAPARTCPGLAGRLV